MWWTSLDPSIEIAFACRAPETAEELVQTLVEQTPIEHCRVERLDPAAPLVVDEDCRALVNATPVGSNDPDAHLPIAAESLTKKTLVADVVYNPPQTWLMRQAELQDCPAIDGLTLLIEQAALAFEIWTGASADRQAMREAVEEFLVL